MGGRRHFVCSLDREYSREIPRGASCTSTARGADVWLKRFSDSPAAEIGLSFQHPSLQRRCSGFCWPYGGQGAKFLVQIVDEHRRQIFQSLSKEMICELCLCLVFVSSLFSLRFGKTRAVSHRWGKMNSVAVQFHVIFPSETDMAVNIVIRVE